MHKSCPKKMDTYTLPSWLFLRKKLRYCCINLIFYHSFFQNYTKIIAVLFFEKKHGSYRVNLSEKNKKLSQKSDRMMIFSLNMLQKRTQLQFWMKMAFSPEVGPGSQGPQGPKRHIFLIKKEFFFFWVFLWSKKLAHLILRCQAYGHCTA